MKKSLYFTFLLLTLLAVTDAKAQNYSSEMGGTCNGTGIWCRALNSDADIYTEVYDESAYEFNDYSEYGDFSQEVVHSDGTREHINYGSNEGSASYGIKTSKYRIDYYDSNGTFLYSEELVADKDGGWLDEVEKEGRGKMYCPWCGEYIYTDEWNYHKCPSLIPPYFPETGSGNGGGGGAAGPSNGNGATAGAPPTNIKKWKKITVQQLKMIPNIHSVPNLPNKFLSQKWKYECVANSIAIAAGITDGTDPEETRKAIRQIAKEADLDLRRDGIPLGEIKSLLYDYCAITDDNKFSRAIIENYIDSEHRPIMAVTEVFDEDYHYLGAHMVVIVAHDALNYYCAIGDEEVAIIPKEDLEVKTPVSKTMQYNLYMYNGKKRKNK